jgi:hypothetical protein
MALSPEVHSALTASTRAGVPLNASVHGAIRRFDLKELEMFVRG